MPATHKDQLTAQLHKMENEYEALRKDAASDGKVTPDEQKALNEAKAKLVAVREYVISLGRPEPPDQGGDQPKSVSLPLADYLTEKAWKDELSKHAGKLKDNGLQRALGAYEKLKEDRVKERLATLQSIFKLALDLSSKGAHDLPAVKEYLSKVCEVSVKKQNFIQEGGDDVPKAPTAVEKRLAEEMVLKAASDIAVNAQANVSTFASEIGDACSEFQNYASSRLGEIEDEITAHELLGALVSAAMPKLAEKLVEKVSHELGKKLVKKFTDTVQSKLTSAIKATADESSKKALEKAVQTMVTAGRDSRSALLEIVTKTIIPLCDEVTRSVNAGKQLNDKLTSFIEPFLRASKTEVDSKLESWFGIPPVKKSQEAQLKLYQGLVRALEEKVIIAQTPSNEKMEWLVKGKPTDRIRRAADLKAQKATDERSKAMHGNMAKRP
jgi:hypothetical protein